jgi:putative DNA primase/helicase
LGSHIEAPAWIGDGEPPFSAAECLVGKNKIVHLPSFLEGGDYSRPLTPRLFTTSALDFNFDADAPTPVEWLAFLQSIWRGDIDAIDCLREWFGYCLLPDTSLHKILLIVGPPRSGKGTIARILRALIGAMNVAAPTLASLGTNFGLWPLLGKPLAIISDARLGGRAELAAITERFLSISGEDAITIDRKNQEPLTTKLPTRFMVLTNELPRLSDASGALANRMIILRLTESFLGKEDRGLTDRLLAELPGILLWAITGWDRLRRRGHFDEPATAADIRSEFNDLTSPVAAFVRECCEVGPAFIVTRADLYAAYKTWCEEAGRQHIEDQAGFGRSLRAVLPQLASPQKRINGEVTRCYQGIGLQV